MKITYTPPYSYLNSRCTVAHVASNTTNHIYDTIIPMGRKCDNQFTDQDDSRNICQSQPTFIGVYQQGD